MAYVGIFTTASGQDDHAAEIPILCANAELYDRT